MQTMVGGEVIRRIVEGCERLGYAISSFELNAADFGVPQLRRRIFFRKKMLIHPSQNRGLSVREAARLQAFPDRYDILGPMGAQQQVSDAVPPLLAREVAMVLARRIA